jgi:23S rRNA (uracil1939-C5)-methyltransferase
MTTTSEIISAQTVDLTIEKLVYGGDGLGRLPEGEIVFVPWSAPGDRLAVVRQAGHQKPARADIMTVQTPGPERTQAPCSVFGRCGGCQWQHITGQAQRDWKRRIVEESLQRIGKLANVPVRETIGSDETAWRYRNRAQWEIEPVTQELAAAISHQVGYYAAQSHEVIEFDHCHIIPEALNALALHVRQYIKQQPKLASGLLRIEAMINRAGEIVLLVEGEAGPRLQAMAEALMQAFPNVIGISHRNGARKESAPRVIAGQPALVETLGGHSFQISAGSFFQTNLHGADAILRTLDDWLLPEPESLLDVYAGVGVFAIHFGQRVKRIVAVESSKTAVADAQANITRNGAAQVVLKTGDARLQLPRLRESFDAAILDPPRAGCQREVLSWLSTHIRRQLLYVSCNPTTLARDLKTLTEQGWQVQAVQPIDMFPQTYHIECVANLIRET